MTLSFTGRKRLRKNFGKIQEIAQMPNLIEVQRTSYDQFLQLVKGDVRRDERIAVGRRGCVTRLDRALFRFGW